MALDAGSLPPRPASAARTRPASAASGRWRGGDYAAVDDFAAGLGRGTRGLGECAAEPGDTPDPGASGILDISASSGPRGPMSRWQLQADSPTPSIGAADAAIGHYRSQSLQRWFEAKEKQQQMEAREAATRREAAEASQRGGRKRETLRQKMADRKEREEEEMRKAREETARLLKEDLDKAADERARDAEDRKMHRQWAGKRRGELKSERQQRVEHTMERRRRVKSWEREMMDGDRTVDHALRDSELTDVQRGVAAHRAARVAVLRRVQGRNCETVRAIRRAQREKEEAKERRVRDMRVLKHDDLRDAAKRRREAREREVEERERLVLEQAAKVKARKEQMQQEVVQQRERDRALAQAAWRERYIDGSFPPEVKEGARQQFRTVSDGRGAWQRLAWDDRSWELGLSLLRQQSQQLRGDSPAFSPTRRRSPRRGLAPPPRPGSAPPGRGPPAASSADAHRATSPVAGSAAGTAPAG